MARVSCPTFVGRGWELGRLEEAFARASEGMAGMVVVGGDAGIGKTRLLDEFAAQVKDRGRVLVGSCVALGEGTLPYAPVVEVLRQVASVHDKEGTEALMGPGSGVLGRLLPEVVMVESANRDPSGPEGQGRLFEAVLTVLMRLGESLPTIVVLEDLHWADSSTRELLIYLAGKLRHGRVLIAGTFRTDELHRRHPLRKLLVELERRGRVDRLDLRGFDRSELSEQLAGIIGERPPARMIEAVLARSEGNAFYAEELIAGAAFNVGLSPSLRDVVLSRVDALPESAARVLRVAAVVGRRVEHGLLADVAGIAETELEQGLRDAVDAQVILAQPDDDTYVFRHALTQEAVYGDLMPGERRRLHTRVAEALAARPVQAGGPGARQASELAYHWYAARDLSRSLAAAVRAGQLAESVDAPAEGQAHYERALDTWAKVPEPEAIAGCGHTTLLERAGYCAFLAGALEQASALLQTALGEVDPQVDAHRAALLHEQLGLCQLVAGDIPSACAAWGTARHLLDHEPPSADKARVIHGEARGLTHQLRCTEAAELAREALTLARQVEDRMLEGRALNTLGVALASTGRADEGIAYIEQSRAIAVTDGMPEDIVRVYTNLCAILDLAAGRTAEAVEMARRGIAEAERLGVMDAIAVWTVAYGAEALLRLGRWDEAEEMAGLALLDDTHTSAAIRRSHVLAGLEIRRGLFSQARRRLESVAGVLSRAGGEEWARFHSRKAELAIWEHDYDEGLDAARAGLSVVAGGDDEFYPHELCVYAVRAAVEAGRTTPEVLALVDEARRLCRRPLEVGLLPSPDAVVNALVVDAEYTRLENADPDRWAEVAAGWTALCRPFELAYAKWREAEAVLAGHGSRVRAAQALSEAHYTAIDLGATALADEVEHLAIRTRIDLQRPAVLIPSVLGGGEVGLTPREAEVLALLGRGYTNREIAEELFISEKTASVHVSNILRKLQVGNRFEAAAVGQRFGA